MQSTARILAKQMGQLRAQKERMMQVKGTLSGVAMTTSVGHAVISLVCQNLRFIIAIEHVRCFRR